MLRTGIREQGWRRQGGGTEGTQAAGGQEQIFAEVQVRPGRALTLSFVTLLLAPYMGG